MKYYQSDLWRNYVRTREDLYNVLIPDHAEVSMVSEENWLERGGCFSGEDIGIKVNRGISATWISDSSISMRRATSISVL